MEMKISIRSSDDVKSSLHTEALKLADEWDIYIGMGNDLTFFKDTRAMIRRLVEELDEKNYRILELTKRYKALTWNDEQTKCPDCGEVNPAEIHTCSPQTKPLSDEEIEQLAKRKANQILMDLLMPDVGEPKKIDWNIGCTNQHLVNFARAIEERHGIK